MTREQQRLPEWFKVPLPSGTAASAVVRRVRSLHLHTVCEEARCPNLGRCWSDGTATLLILGDTCTRNCRFCAVATGNPKGVLDIDEPDRVAEAVKSSGLRYVVLTSVDRDDLPDGGAKQYAAVIRAVHEATPSVLVEVLTPDFLGDCLATVLGARPHVFGHNIEVVRRLTPIARDRRASYDRSMEVLRTAASVAPGIPTKSSLMLGLGETRQEVTETFQDMLQAGVSILTLGQYLRPTHKHLPVERFLPPSEFDDLADEARQMGFTRVASGPLVRSSYLAERLFDGRAVQ